MREEFPHHTKYTHEIQVTPIRNQCGYGGCWIYGTLSKLEQEIFEETGKITNQSEQYLI